MGAVYTRMLVVGDVELVRIAVSHRGQLPGGESLSLFLQDRMYRLVRSEQLRIPSLFTKYQPFSSVHKPSTASRQDALLINDTIREKIMARTHSRNPLPMFTKSAYNSTLAQINLAIKTRNLSDALQSWAAFETHRKSHHDANACRLPEYTIKDLQNLFVSSVSISHDNTWITSSTAKAFAMYAAMYHSEEALYSLMLHYIKSGDYQTVLQLYEEYRPRLCKDDLTSSAVVVRQEGSSLSPLLDEEHESEKYYQARTLVVIAAVAAHTVNDAFKEAFDLYLDSGVLIRSFHKIKFFRQLQGHAHLVTKVKPHLDRLMVASLVARPASFSRHIMNMGHPHSAKMLQAYYNKILMGIRGPRPYLAAQPSGLSDSRLVAMTESGWTSFQTAFIRCERIDAAAKVWDDLAAEGIKPGVSMWTGLLDTYADLRNSSQAMATWNMMLQHDILPDTLSYRAIISVLLDDNSATAALDRFSEYQKILDKRNESALPVYNTVLRGLLRVNRVEEAKNLLEEMKFQGPKPDRVSFNTFLGYFARQKDFQGLGDILSQMSTADIQGDVVTFSTILTALLAVGRKDAPTTIINLMRKQGIKPNAATYTAVIDSQMREESRANLGAALTLLDKMEKEEGIKPNEITYTAILAGLYRGQWLSRDEADKIRQKLITKMRRDGILFRLPTYHILLRASLESEDSLAYQDALKLIREMMQKGIPRVGNTWYILLAGLMKRELWKVAYEIGRAHV